MTIDQYRIPASPGVTMGLFLRGRLRNDIVGGGPDGHRAPRRSLVRAGLALATTGALACRWGFW